MKSTLLLAPRCDGLCDRCKVTQTGRQDAEWR